MNKLAIFGLLCALAAPAAAIEVKAAPAQCSAADVKAGKGLWAQIDKAPDGSEVVLTNTETWQLWCYADAAKNGARPDTTLKVSLTIVPDPDADADGVPDGADKCPKTPPDCTYTLDGKVYECNSRVPVDARGCPQR